MVFFPGKRFAFESAPTLSLRSGSPSDPKELANALATTPDRSLRELQDIWNARPRGGWIDHPDIYSQLGEQVLRKGEPLIAYDILVEGSKHRPRDVRLRQLLGLTLARSGAIDRGNALLRKLHNEGHADGETLGILAGTFKDLWADSADPLVGHKFLEQAHRVYHRAYQSSLDRQEVDSAYYNGINAAATALLLGFAEKATKLAEATDRLCEQALSTHHPNGDEYWALATQGEAALILGDVSRAARHYRDAVDSCHGRYADLAVTRSQARLLLSHHAQNPGLLDECFKLPTVVVFAGCERECLEPTPELERTLQQTIRERLKSLDAGFGYTSLHGLSDLVFIEELLALRGEAHIVMPMAPNAFRKNLGTLAADTEWLRRYEQALDRATQVQGVTELAEADSPRFRNYTQRVLDGLGRLHSDALETPLALMALARDGRPLVSDSLAGCWGENGVLIERIEIGGLEQRRTPEFRSSSDNGPPSDENPDPHRVMALLFADVVGYSHILEQEIPAFVQHFLGAVAELESHSNHHPVQKNTWGDALYFVFERIEDAALFALELSALVNKTDWREKGISTPVDLRIALHAGPVYRCDDPIMQRPSFCGSHVNWAARIEPITPPGQVYASQPFAALIKAQEIPSIRCDYVGQVPLAKRYGDFPLYHVQQIDSNRTGGNRRFHLA